MGDPPYLPGRHKEVNFRCALHNKPFQSAIKNRPNPYSMPILYFGALTRIASGHLKIVRKSFDVAVFIIYMRGDGFVGTLSSCIN